MTMHWKEWLTTIKQPNEAAYQYALESKVIPFHIRASIIRKFRKGVKNDSRSIKASTLKGRKEEARRPPTEKASKTKSKRLPKRYQVQPQPMRTNHGSKHNYRRVQQHDVRISYTSGGKGRPSRRTKIRHVPRAVLVHLKGPQGLWHKGEQDA